VGQGKGARARQKAKREAWLANRTYWGFTCRGCKHEDMMHTLFVWNCIVEGCDCSKMDEIKEEPR
jgi:hypothetical protein